MQNRYVPALALCCFFSGAMHCAGQSWTDLVSVRGYLTDGSGVLRGRYSVGLANVAGSTREYLTDAEPSGQFELPPVEAGNYTYRVRNHLGQVVQTGFVRVDREVQELNISLPTRSTEELPAGGAISARRLAHQPVKAAKNEFLKAQAAARKGDRDAALRYYERAVGIDPGWYEARVNFGAQLHRAGRISHALIQAQAAIAIDPASAEAYINASAVLSAMGNYPEAAQAAARAVQLAPQSANSRFLLGLALLGMSRVNEAVEHLRRAESFAPAQELLTRILAADSSHLPAENEK